MEALAQLLTPAPVMLGGQECSAKQVSNMWITNLAAHIRNVVSESCLRASHYVLSLCHPLQLSTVVILVLLQMVNLLTPVQPTAPMYTLPVM